MIDEPKNISDSNTAFNDIAFDAETTACIFNRPYGTVLRHFQILSNDDFDRVGDVQANTIVLGQLMAETSTAELAKEKIKQKFGGVNLSNIPFQQDMSSDQIIDDLNVFTQQLCKDLGVDNYEQRFQAGKDEIQHALDNEGSVQSNAADVGAIIKGLFLQGAEKKLIPEASFIMQFGLRYLAIKRGLELDPKNVHFAKKVLEQNHRFNPGDEDLDGEYSEYHGRSKYFPDGPWVQHVQGVLRSFAQLQINMNGRRAKPYEEMMVKDFSNTVIAGFEKAAQYYEQVDKPVLASMARKLRKEMAIDYLGYSEVDLANASPEAVEVYEKSLGTRDAGNSPYSWLPKIVAK